MICKQCGSIFDATKHKFCLSCGASIFLIPPKPPQLPLTSLPTSKSPKKSHGKRFGALGGVFGIVLILVAVGSVPDFVPESNEILLQETYNEKGDERYPLPYNDSINEIGYTANVLADKLREVPLYIDWIGWCNITLQWNPLRGNLTLNKIIFDDGEIVKEIIEDGFYSLLLQRITYGPTILHHIGNLSICNETNTMILFDIYIEHAQHPENPNYDIDSAFYFDAYWKYDNPMVSRYCSLKTFNREIGFNLMFFAVWLNLNEKITVFYETSGSDAQWGEIYNPSKEHLFCDIFTGINKTYTASTQGYHYIQNPQTSTNAGIYNLTVWIE